GYRSAMRIFRLPEENEFSMHLARMTGEVLILSEPAGAAIVIDGTRRRETTPATLQVAAGKHTISVAKEGYTPHEEEIEVKDSAFVRLSINLGKRGQ
ncbi:MAG: PEGA domain-containing protein, partial [Acidobacteriales bacterium]